MNFKDRYIPEPNSGCWLWLGATNEKGYALINVKSLNGTWATRRAHRVAYEAAQGAIPKELVIDHKCRVRCCVNPYHLEPVTNAENIRRGLAGINSSAKDKCPEGHPYSGSNSRGARICHQCMATANRRSRERV